MGFIQGLILAVYRINSNLRHLQINRGQGGWLSNKQIIGVMSSPPTATVTVCSFEP